MAVTASSGGFLITPNVGLMIWTLLLFLISMYVLYKLAFPRISEALDRRQRAIEDSIDEAERIRHDANELLGEYRERLLQKQAEVLAGLEGRNRQEYLLMLNLVSKYARPPEAAETHSLSLLSIMLPWPRPLDSLLIDVIASIQRHGGIDSAI